MEESSFRKRKNNHQNSPDEEVFDEERLTLRLSLPSPKPKPPSLPPPPPPSPSPSPPSSIVLPITDDALMSRLAHGNDNKANDMNPPPVPPPSPPLFSPPSNMLPFTVGSSLLPHNFGPLCRRTHGDAIEVDDIDPPLRPRSPPPATLNVFPSTVGPSLPQNMGPLRYTWPTHGNAIEVKDIGPPPLSLPLPPQAVPPTKLPFPAGPSTLPQIGPLRYTWRTHGNTIKVDDVGQPPLSLPSPPPLNVFPFTAGPSTLPQNLGPLRPPWRPHGNGIGNNDLDHPPHPWASTHPAKILTLDQLQALQIHTVEGEICCKLCLYKGQSSLNLHTRFDQISSFIRSNKSTMHQRAPDRWMHPELGRCPRCHIANMLKPVTSSDGRLINWLFLLLGETLGCLTVVQLKYFCRYNNIHSTGAKDRLVYCTYLALCKQLDPSGPFDLE